MIALRRLAFTAWTYGLLAVLGLGGLPLLLGPRRYRLAAMRTWTDGVLWGLRVIMGVTVEIRGREHMPHGAALIAAKHLSMLDTVAPFSALNGAAFVLKRELLRLPIFGWFVGRAGMIAVDRDAHSQALKQLLREAREVLSENRQLIIFPEGTRQPIGAAPDYKPGVAALYRDLNVPCTPLATNSGEHWPAHGGGYTPGRVVFEFLPPIPPGLKRQAFMAELEARIEAGTKALLGS